MDSTFLIWAGGKNWFVKNQNARFPKDFKRYIDPFLGGGSVYFYLEPKEALISDSNYELIKTYTAIQKNWKGLERRLKEHERKHCDDYYYEIRSKHPRSMVDIAARMIYLNRTCFNGIYRVNRNGEFNVARGSKDTVFNGKEEFEKRSKILMGSKILCCDFEETIDQACSGDFLFCDPPYAVDNGTSYVGYTQDRFAWEDQIRLAEALDRARKRKVKILMTNTNHPSIKALYENRKGFQIDETSRTCVISGNGLGRGRYSELIVSANM